MGHHDHDDPRGRHQHGPLVTAGTDRRLLAWALALILAFMAVEVVIGFAAGSLALLSDAAHMLTDAASIALALLAMRLAARPPRGGYTYGLKRAEILSAQANGLTLLLLAGWLGVEAVLRLWEPAEVAGAAVLWTALAGIVVNLVATVLIGRANRRSLNIEGAYQHILTDLAAFIATAVAGAVILLTGFVQADTIASLVVVALMLKAGLALLRDSGRVLLERAPAGLEPAGINARMRTVDGVVDVHDLHVWEITSGEPALSAHVLVRPGVDCHGARLAIEAVLLEGYRLTHTTLQVDHAGPEILPIGRTGP
ncbi:cation diffusion facilitator family transporter [Luedemannella helvata]|uniref:Cation diffusion facilitator family transporter n=1 Tax=Luedemannella helvata TaxID=349315 RepID=A0ABN2L2I3_9ACTN